MPSTETPPTTLAALIAEERRAVAADLVATREADLALFAWRDANPYLDEKTDLPAPIAELQAKVEAASEAAHSLTDHVVNWIPDNLADAVVARGPFGQSCIFRPDFSFSRNISTRRERYAPPS
jgi:hypothetical protein